MTVPGVRVTSVRRTVGIAVALVTGQALLCGVIGIVTFSDRSTSAPAAQAPEPQLAGPPPVVPSAGTPPVDAPAGRPEPGTTRYGRIELPTSPQASVAVRNSATRTVGPSRTASVSPAPAPATSPSDLALIPPSPAAPEDDAPIPAVERERCDDEGALGETAAGKAVRCERDRRGDLRWRVV
ncbi:hypothetical protein DMB66_10150 [Actinoplanes sp. ATCC 53533]|uniref:hypothetical protein n=1 Tax=Actinoplanes sp. ATCC 53533 TaxID=1288362 RepID=UPI000F7901C2|nr:hypothetical protein [Actinoplanes sp. ATCC 53533]RSM69881.1 hypothetical protein DMB66_10150 [Actinoplanes sp. ATCC 53533]